MSTDDTRSSLNSPIALFGRRLMVDSYKLDLRARQIPDPSKWQPRGAGSIVIKWEVADEIDSLYCLFADHLTQAGLLETGPLIDRFVE
jgi:hypothetical protein